MCNRSQNAPFWSLHLHCGLHGPALSRSSQQGGGGERHSGMTCCECDRALEVHDQWNRLERATGLLVGVMDRRSDDAAARSETDAEADLNRIDCTDLLHRLCGPRLLAPIVNRNAADAAAYALARFVESAHPGIDFRKARYERRTTPPASFLICVEALWSLIPTNRSAWLAPASDLAERAWRHVLDRSRVNRGQVDPHAPVWALPLRCHRHDVDRLLTTNDRRQGMSAVMGNGADFVYWRDVDACPLCGWLERAHAFWNDLAACCGLDVGLDDRHSPELARRAEAKRIVLSDMLEALHGRRRWPWSDYDATVQRPGRRGPPILPRPDIVAGALAVYFEAAGGTVEAQMKNASDATPQTPFARFIAAIWDHLPADPHVRLQSPRAMVNRARETVAGRRHPERGLQPRAMIEPVTLKVVAPVPLRGHPPGETFIVSGSKGRPWDRYWAKQIADGGVIIVGS